MKANLTVSLFVSLVFKNFKLLAAERSSEQTGKLVSE